MWKKIRQIKEQASNKFYHQQFATQDEIAPLLREQVNTHFHTLITKTNAIIDLLEAPRPESCLAASNSKKAKNVDQTQATDAETGVAALLTEIRDVIDPLVKELHKKKEGKKSNDVREEEDNNEEEGSSKDEASSEAENRSEKEKKGKEKMVEQVLFQLNDSVATRNTRKVGAILAKIQNVTEHLGGAKEAHNLCLQKLEDLLPGKGTNQINKNNKTILAHRIEMSMQQASAAVLILHLYEKAAKAYQSVIENEMVLKNITKQKKIIINNAEIIGPSLIVNDDEVPKEKMTALNQAREAVIEIEKQLIKANILRADVKTLQKEAEKIKIPDKISLLDSNLIEAEQVQANQNLNKGENEYNLVQIKDFDQSKRTKEAREAIEAANNYFTYHVPTVEQLNLEKVEIARLEKNLKQKQTLSYANALDPIRYKYPLGVLEWAFEIPFITTVMFTPKGKSTLLLPHLGHWLLRTTSSHYLLTFPLVSFLTQLIILNRYKCRSSECEQDPPTSYYVAATVNEAFSWTSPISADKNFMKDPRGIMCVLFVIGVGLYIAADLFFRRFNNSFARYNQDSPHSIFKFLLNVFTFFGISMLTAWLIASEKISDKGVNNYGIIATAMLSLFIARAVSTLFAGVGMTLFPRLWQRDWVIRTQGEKHFQDLELQSPLVVAPKRTCGILALKPIPPYEGEGLKVDASPNLV